MKRIDTYKLLNFEELFENIDNGSDVEFFLKDKRYNISWRDNKPFICECPEGEAVFFENTNDLLCNYKVDGIPIKDFWQEMKMY